MVDMRGGLELFVVTTAVVVQNRLSPKLTIPLIAGAVIKVIFGFVSVTDRGDFSYPTRRRHSDTIVVSAQTFGHLDVRGSSRESGSGILCGTNTPLSHV
jgi:hypothetical protein